MTLSKQFRKVASGASSRLKTGTGEPPLPLTDVSLRQGRAVQGGQFPQFQSCSQDWEPGKEGLTDPRSVKARAGEGSQAHTLPIPRQTHISRPESVIREVCRLRGDGDEHANALVAEALGLPVADRRDLAEHFNAQAALWRSVRGLPATTTPPVPPQAAVGPIPARRAPVPAFGAVAAAHAAGLKSFPTGREATTSKD